MDPKVVEVPCRCGGENFCDAFRRWIKSRPESARDIARKIGVNRGTLTRWGAQRNSTIPVWVIQRLVQITQDDFLLRWLVAQADIRHEDGDE